MNVLSLFDGISCARVALSKLNISNTYYASEVDKYAIEISKKNYPDIIQLGDVKNVYGKETCLVNDSGITDEPGTLKKIDLLIGGSPCQNLSIAGDRKGLEGEKSKLFYEYVRILKEVKPKYFILENVASMKTSDRDIITKELFGIEPVMINASLVSAQQRKRYFWVGKRVGDTYERVDIPQPKDREIYLKDIIHETRGEDFDLEKYIIKGNHLEWIQKDERLKKKYTQINGDKAITMTARQYASWNGTYIKQPKRVGQIGKGGQGDRIYSVNGKSVNLSALGGGRGAKTGLYFIGNEYVRKLTTIECCRLQGLPDNHTQGVSDSQQYKALGNAFNADVMAHIISFLK